VSSNATLSSTGGVSSGSKGFLRGASWQAVRKSGTTRQPQKRVENIRSISLIRGMRSAVVFQKTGFLGLWYEKCNRRAKEIINPEKEFPGLKFSRFLDEAGDLKADCQG